MNKEKLVPIAKGLIKHLPFVKKLLPKRTGGTIESRYCYSVWMRHLINLNAFNDTVPEIVTELGPGDSLGTGLSALLSGSKQLYVLDIVKYWENKRNLKIFNELVELFNNKTSIPDNIEYPLVRPELENYSFPSYIITDKILNESLSENRLDAIRKEILDINNPDNSFIIFKMPWHGSNIITDNNVDFVFSQAVLQQVEDLDNIYSAISKWIKPLGFMSHTIDFKSQGVTKSWNGYWTFSDFEWNIVRGGKLYLMNRQPFSKHIELHSKYGFKILVNVNVKLENKLNISQLSKKFQKLSVEDLTTSGVYILSKKE